MSTWEWSDKLKLGKASAFVKRDIRSLPLTEAEFEADFFLDSEHSTKRQEVWMGMVVEREFGGLLAMEDDGIAIPRRDQGGFAEAVPGTKTYIVR